MERKGPNPAGSIRPGPLVKKSEWPGLAKLSFQSALDTALQATPGHVIKAELEVENGNLQYSFEIFTADQKVTEVEIDAGDGRVLDIDPAPKK